MAGPGGRIHKVGIDNVVLTVTGTDGTNVATVVLDDNKSKSKKLIVAWTERESVTVDF